MNGRYRVVICMMAALLFSQAYAEQRVLFSFDESGHYVHRIFSVNARRSLKQLEAAERREQTDPLATALAQMKPGRATLIWQSQNLDWLATTHVPDPRITHSPEHASNSNATRAGLLTGGWIADGPDEAERVLVLLPAHPILNLGLERWPLWLTR